MYLIYESSIVITHNAGFFSCCSVKLHSIVEYINLNKKLPILVDSSSQFDWYKINKTGDITFDYFKQSDNFDNLEFNNDLNINYNHEHQFLNYSDLDYKNICPIVQKYFSPSDDINHIIINIEQKYNLDYNNICVLFYRGNDKNRETQICGYHDYITYANLIISKNPNVKFLIQSDETEFIEFITNSFPNNSFYFKDEIRHMNKCDNTVDLVLRDTSYIFSKYYLAITIIMSRCKYIICGSGNCSIWIMFYRGNNENVYQNLNNIWLK